METGRLCLSLDRRNVTGALVNCDREREREREQQQSIEFV